METHLAASLMLELVVFAEEAIAKGTLEDAAAVLPDSSLAFEAHGVLQGAGACVCLEALAAVADPRLTEVAYGTHHTQAGGVHTRMLHHTVACLQHALDLAALGAYRKSLDTLTKIAERPRLLLLFALVAVHRCIAGEIG